MWKMLQNHVFSRNTALFDNEKRLKITRYYILKINI